MHIKILPMVDDCGYVVVYSHAVRSRELRVDVFPGEKEEGGEPFLTLTQGPLALSNVAAYVRLIHAAVAFGRDSLSVRREQ